MTNLRGTILLVDDEEKILKALGRALRDDGHDVVETTSPRQAQRLLAERSFDVVIVDNVMRELSGLEAPVRDFVLGNAETVRFVDGVVEMLTWQLPAFQREGKSYLTVAFGCTGGHHRSVAIAEEVARRLGENITARHRDVAR